jgi:cytochrome c oxidase assembly protein subunit 15
MLGVAAYDRRGMRVPRLSPMAYRRITIVAAVLLAIIIVTGGAVRLSDSGLGCPTWPNCATGQLTAHAQSDSHQWIESLNRMFTGLVSVAVIVAVLGSLVRVPKRRDLIWLSIGLVAGVFAQAVLGGLTVLFDLKPGFVMAHFLLSIVLLTNALVLVRRAGQPDAPAHAVVTPRTVVLGRVLLVLAGAVLVTGTVVTGAGPHSGGGKRDDVSRFDLRIPDVARVHGTTVMIFLAAVLFMVWLLRRDRAPHNVQQRVTLLLVVLVAQAAVGYVQYFNDIPAVLVGVHIAGATAVWSATLALYLGLFERTPAVAPVPPDEGATDPLLAPA